MKKKLLGAVLSVAMVATLLAGCGGGASEAAPAAAPAAPAATEEKADDAAPAADATEEKADDAAADSAAGGAGGLVGVAMPTKDLQRWNQDGSNMEAELKAAGYDVDLQFASNDVSTQVSQIENMINGGCQCLVIAAIDSESLGDVLAKAKDANIPVISYDRLIMNTDAITYYATFDNYKVGTVQGEYVRDTLDLDNADGPFNIEFTAGDPGDNNAGFFFNGAYDVLKKYIDDGKLVVKSGQKTFEEVATASWATETAQSRAENILSSYYTSEMIDAGLC